VIRHPEQLDVPRVEDPLDLGLRNRVVPKRLGCSVGAAGKDRLLGVAHDAGLRGVERHAGRKGIEEAVPDEQRVVTGLSQGLGRGQREESEHRRECSAKRDQHRANIATLTRAVTTLGGRLPSLAALLLLDCRTAFGERIFLAKRTGPTFSSTRRSVAAPHRTKGLFGHEGMAAQNGEDDVFSQLSNARLDTQAHLRLSRWSRRRSSAT
jgi:hypothetical protein